jgi:argininosuccinate lyase
MAKRKPAKGSPSRSGVFSRPADPRLEAFAQSISYDQALYRYDIQGSLAHAEMLRAVGLLTAQEEAAIRKGLEAICTQIESGRFTFNRQLEDVHMNIERALEERIGAPAKKLHTARSRNDQIALDERLWVRDECRRLAALVEEAQRALVALAERHAADVMPGYTHLQRAQPVTCGHYLLAFVEMLERDKDRLADAFRRADVLPLGACALAGTSLPIDRRRVAKLLGFSGCTRNSMDTTADRDFLLDFAYAQAVCALHLSRLAEDFILFATVEFGFLQIDDAFTTGSSIMPQKRNPDVLELIRGKTAHAVACLQHFMVLMKGLPLTYNRDLQEDKESLFNATRQHAACLEILTALLRNVSFRRQRMESACRDGYLDATAVAEFLVRKGLAFREAHHIAGTLVRKALEKHSPLAGLSKAELLAVHPKLAGVQEVLSPRRMVEAYRSEGSPNPKFVRSEIAAWKRRLGE